MSTKPQIELFLENENGSQQVAYPFVESDHVLLSNGMDIDTMIRQDVSMPTVAHEDLSFKVGVGDQDVSSAIVDSSVAEMTIKGKTYQNILPEPSTHVLSNNKEMFKVNEGLDPNVEIVDGVSKSAILSGQTLVNLVQQKNMYLLFGTSGQGKVNRTITTSGAIYETSRDDLNSYITIRTEAYPLIKPNTSYTIFFEVVQNTITKNGVEYKGVTVSGYNDSYYGRAGEKQLYHNGEFSLSKGLKKIVITTPSSVASYDGLGFGFPSFAANETPQGQVFEIQNVMIIEGDYTNVDIPYFEGMASCKMPVLTTTGKNLLNPSLIKINMTLGSDGITEAGFNGRATTDFISIKPNTAYALGGNGSGDYYYVEYDFSKNPIDARKSTSQTFTSTSNTHWVRFFRYSIIDTGLLSSVSEVEYSLEESSSATSYEPYKSNILSCEFVPMNQSMFEQGTFAESTPPNTQTYEQIKLDSNLFYDTRIRTKGTYKVVKGATYSGQLNNGYGIFICYCKNGLYSAKDKGWIDETNFTFTVPNDCDEMFFALRKTDNSAITPSDYPLIGLKIHQEVVLRSLPNGVKDTLNLMTGEYVQRIEEHVLDGTTNNASRDWNICWNDYSTNTLTFEGYTPTKKLINTNGAHTTTIPKNFICDKVKVLGFGSMWQNGQAVDRELSITTYTGGQLIFVIEKSKLTTMDVSGFKQWLSQNPVTIQYELETPVVKTVDLSSSGNWEKVVLDGTQAATWQDGSISAFYIRENRLEKLQDYSRAIITDTGLVVTNYRKFTDGSNEIEITGYPDANPNKYPNENWFYIRVPNIKSDTNALKQYLSQNPITVWFKTDIHQDSTQVKQPIFFKDGHIIQSSGADNSLIPTLDYQAKTSNSYVMDLMKANTRYTMKAKTASGTFTIDGTSYGAGTNDTFTTPSSMTNKFLVMSNKTNEEVMILEGDITDKTISYFKGIKSAFEDESQIEVLSTGKNLFDKHEFTRRVLALNTEHTLEGDILSYYSAATHRKRLIEGIFKENTQYTITYEIEIDRTKNFAVCFEYTDGSSNFVDISKATQISDKKYIFAFTSLANKTIDYFCTSFGYNTMVKVDLSKVQLEESPTATTYQPYKSNSTKIPLLSPLRSLPNGVKDELIIDRANNKVALIQRIGEVVFDGSESLSSWIYNDNGTYKSIRTSVNNCIKVTTAIRDSVLVRCDKYIPIHYNAPWTTNKMVSVDVSGNIVFCGDEIRDTKTWINILKSNPTIVYYQLATPVITEVDLEGFPYVYKDGHIFLNGEIAPVTEIKYSINQQHQIESSSQDLIRHQKGIDYLYKLIGEYVRVDYKNTLLSLNLELK